MPLRLRALTASIAPSAMSSLAATITSGGSFMRGERRFGHRQALGAVEAGRLLEDDLVFVAGLVEHVVQALVAVDRRARARLALQVDDRRAVREQLHDQIALRLAALDVVGADMGEDARHLRHAAVDGHHRHAWRPPPPAAPAPSRRPRSGDSTMPLTPLASAASMSAVCLGERHLPVALDHVVAELFAPRP